VGDLTNNHRTEHSREENRGEHVRGRQPPAAGNLSLYLEQGKARYRGYPRSLYRVTGRNQCLPSVEARG